MNIETLRIFCDVVQHQSFSRGAALNDVSQSAATQSVHRMEQHFGVQLVDRTQAAVRAHARRASLLRGLSRGPGNVRRGRGPRPHAADGDQPGWSGVASIYSVGLHDMSRCMQDFMRRYPKAKVRLEYLRPNKVYEAVLNSEVDLGIVSYPAASPEMHVIPLRSERMVLVCPPATSAGPAAGGHRRAPAGRGFRGLRPRPDHPQGDRPLPAAARVTIRVAMEFDNIETIKQAVEIGAGVSILPEPTVRESPRTAPLASSA